MELPDQQESLEQPAPVDPPASLAALVPLALVSQEPPASLAQRVPLALQVSLNHEKLTGTLMSHILRYRTGALCTCIRCGLFIALRSCHP